jgi:hypothetical protein
MEHGLLFRKTSTCYKNPDIEYLDETSDYRLQIKAKALGVSVDLLKSRNDEIGQAVSYLTKENHGRVYAGGFLRDHLLVKKGLAPEKWNNDTRKKAIKTAISQVTKRYGTYRGALGHKMVFSISEGLEKKIEGSGLKLDNLLGREVKKIMYEFQHKFYPGEKIGFAWGIHHDTKHRHVHIYLCNRTDQGNHVAMSSPLDRKFSKYKQKDQIGYIKERCIAAQRRMEIKAENMNCDLPPERVPDIKIEHEKPENLSEGLLQKERELEVIRRDLLSKENLVCLQQENIRRFYSDYYLRKEMVALGWNDIKAINAYIDENYQILKKNNTVVFPKLLNWLGIISDFGPIKIFSKMLFSIHNEQEITRRQAIFDDINQSREYKGRLLDQLKIMDWQKAGFLQRVKEMKAERDGLKKDFYGQHHNYEREILKFNFEFFKETIADQEKINEYYQLGERLRQKRMNRQDSTEELTMIKKLDLEARELSLRKVSEVQTNEYISFQTVREEPKYDNNQGRGIRF